MALELPQDDWRMSNNHEDESAAEGEFFILMSLALDGMLKPDEVSRFHHYMEQDPILANEWQIWQDLTVRFDDEPSMMPPAGFVDSIAVKLLMQERRSKLRLGIMVGAVTTFAWLLLVLALVGAGVYTVMYEGPWLGQQITNLTTLSATVADWFTIVTRDVSRVMNVTVGYYQMWGVVLSYFAAAGLILVYWTRLLRHSVERDNVGQVAPS